MELKVISSATTRDNDYFQQYYKALEPYRLIKTDLNFHDPTSNLESEKKRRGRPHLGYRIELFNLKKFQLFQAMQYEYLPFLDEKVKELVVNCKTLRYLESKELYSFSTYVGVHKPVLITKPQKLLKQNDFVHCNFYRFCIFCAILHSLKTSLATYENWREVIKKYSACYLFVLNKFSVPAKKLGLFYQEVFKFLSLPENSTAIVSLLSIPAEKENTFEFLILYSAKDIMHNAIPTNNQITTFAKVSIELEDILENWLSIIEQKFLVSSLENILRDRTYDIYQARVENIFDWVELNFIYHLPIRFDQQYIKKLDFLHLFFSQVFYSLESFQIDQ